MSHSERNSAPKRVSRRTFMAVGAAGVAVAGATAVYRRSHPRPDLAESVGKVTPVAGAPSPNAPLIPKSFDDLQIRRMSDLDRLPWFMKNETGDLCLRPDVGIGPIIDPHSHLGWAFGFGRSPDMTRKSRVRYFYDYEREQDVLFTQIHPTREEAGAITRENLSLFIKTPRRNLTQTAANLSAEMDRMNYRNIVLLPIEIPKQARHTHDTFQAASLDPRFIPFGALYPKPWGEPMITRLDAQKKTGIKGIKFHPEFQVIAPDNPDMMRVFEYCEANNMIVYSHIGCTGKEPRFMQEKSEPRRFIKALEAFRKVRVVFAHTGVKLMDETLEVARKFEDQVWLDISGRSAANIQYILQRYNTEKIMYASDWPFMPLAIMMARGLVATESCPHLRERFFSGNAARLLALA